MIITSPLGSIKVPQIDLLAYLFPPGEAVSTSPIWLDAANPQNCLTPEQLLHWAKRLSIGLDNLGIETQDVVMIFSPNHIFIPVTYMGVVGSRRVFSAANPDYKAQELSHQLRDTNAKALLVHPTLLDTALQAANVCGLPLNRIFQLSDRPNEPKKGVQDWRKFIGTEEEGEKHRWWTNAGEDVPTKTIAMINYSSGTTGLPKGVCISHTNIIATAEQLIKLKYAGTGYAPLNHPPERWLGILPLYHAYGQLWFMVMAVKLNIPVYIMQCFSFGSFLRTIEKYKVTNLHVAPPVVLMLSKRPETAEYDIRSVKHIMCGAAPLSKELRNSVADRFGVKISNGWGMTELTCGGTCSSFADNDVTGSVGFLLPSMECKLLNEEGDEVGPGAAGEIYIKGPNVCMSYWRNEKATNDSLDAHGWFRTGDVAMVNKKGAFWLVDRKKELIKVKGLQVAPAELEAALLEHDWIADAACVGITLNSLERPRAYVVLREGAKGLVGEADIRQFIASKMARHKHLTGGVVFVDRIPKLASGKILRKVLREWAARDASLWETGARNKL